MTQGVTPFPDQLSSALFGRVTGRIRADLDRAALEAVTGRRADVTLAANGQNGQVARVMRLADAQEAASTRLALGTGRYEQAGAALRTIRATADAVRQTALTAADAGAGAIAAAGQDARGALAGVLGALNTSFDGRALFAGASADGTAVAGADALLAGTAAAMAGAATPADKRAALDAYFAPGGGYETTVYSGADTDAAALKLPDGTTLPALPRADAEGVRDLLKGLAVLAHSSELPPMAMADWVRQGTDLIGGASEAVVAAEARIGSGLSRLEAAEAQLADERLNASRALDRLVGRDAYEAASETQDLETRLQAAYTLTSRLTRLSLTSYLR